MPFESFRQLTFALLVAPATLDRVSYNAGPDLFREAERFLNCHVVVQDITSKVAVAHPWSAEMATTQ